MVTISEEKQHIWIQRKLFRVANILGKKSSKLKQLELSDELSEEFLFKCLSASATSS